MLIALAPKGVALLPDVYTPTTPPLVGREELLSTVDSHLVAGGGVVLVGPSGIGKSAIIGALAAAATERGEFVLRAGGVQTERWIPYAALAELLAQVPDWLLDKLPGAQRSAVDSVLLRGDASPGAGSVAPLAPRLAWLSIMEGYAAEQRPVLVVVDNAQWLDPSSADVIAYAARRLTGSGVRTVVALRESRGTTRAASLCPAPVRELPVPAMAADDLADLLEAHGLPCRTATKLYAESGGNPYLALALGGAFADKADVAWPWVPVPERVRALLRERLAALPLGVRETLLVAALANRPTVPLLVRAGRPDAPREIRHAVDTYLVALESGVVRFTPASVAAVLAEDAVAERREAIHAALASVVTEVDERARHRALSTSRPDAEVARSLVAAAEGARQRGAHGLAAELYLLAAERIPTERFEERLDWLVAAAETAARASRSEIVHRAVDAVFATEGTPAHRVRARLALIDLAGQNLADMDEAFAAALADAAGDPTLLAPLQIRLTWQAMVGGQPERAEREAARAIELARAAGDQAVEALALAVCAQVERVQGKSEFAGTLARALELPEPPLTGWLNMTPGFLAARFALFDDLLEVARSELLRMLSIVERGGGEDLIDVLRSLAEVAARSGRAREALDFAGRAIRVTEETGNSPGPVWYTAATAELVGGTLPRAQAYAERGLRASRQEHDAIYLSRNLYALGQARLRLGDARSAVQILREVRDLEAAQAIADPSVLRWHADLAAALVAVGELDEAKTVIELGRTGPHGQPVAPGVAARMDRSEALVFSERGDSEAAVKQLVSATRAFAALGQPIEQGHTLLVTAQVERRRRRYAAARTAAAEALAIFAAVDATPWVEQAARTLARVDGGPPAVPASPAPRGSNESGGLTPTEARIASLVREGASNREIAAQLFLSVKTVEATLTRIYRKLGVRSRTQLSSRLAD